MVSKESTWWEGSPNYTAPHVSSFMGTNLIITIKQATSQENEYARLQIKIVSVIDIRQSRNMLYSNSINY
jgi:hypothetical protein